jgi:hypothetical protein
MNIENGQKNLDKIIKNILENFIKIIIKKTNISILGGLYCTEQLNI